MTYTGTARCELWHSCCSQAREMLDNHFLKIRDQLSRSKVTD